MQPQQIIAQIVGTVALGFNSLSYLQKKNSTLLLFQLIGSALFCTNYLLLGAMSGAILNVVGIFRAIIFLWKDKLHADNIFWTSGFIGAYLSSYALIFTVFGKEPTVPNLIIEILPVIAMIAIHLSFRYTSTKMVRRFGLVSSPMWLTYNIAIFSIPAIICEIVNLSSIIIGILKFDIKRKEK